MYVTSPINPCDSEIRFSRTFENEVQPSWSQLRTFYPGESLYYEGDDAEYIYQIVEGVVRSSKVLVDGRRQVLNFGYPGEMMGLSHDRFYHSDCDAVSEVKVRVLQKNAHKLDFAETPEFCALLLKNAAAEVNNMQEHFIMLGRKSAIEKIASFLVAIMDRHSEANGCKKCFDIPMMRCDIADFLGLTIETISRNLTKIRKMGIIEMPKAHRVCVCKPDDLRKLAESDNE